MTSGSSGRFGMARFILILLGCGAVAWTVLAFPMFWSEIGITRIAAGIKAGEAYKPEIVTAAEMRIVRDENLRRREIGSNALVLVRLYRTEFAINAGDIDSVDRELGSLAEAVDASLAIDPGDSFVWLVRFWLENVRFGIRAEHIRLLQASYDLGPYEGWVAIKRSRLALTAASMLPDALAQRASDEFVNLIRWGLVTEAADVAARLDRPSRESLFLRLMNVPLEQRRRFANLWYRRDLDNLAVPGVNPPPAPFRMPVVPPGY